MKKITLFIVFLTLTNLSLRAQKSINWITLEEAILLQKKNPKKIIMDMYTVWCGPCKLLDKNTFKNKGVINYINENYYAVKFNAEGNDVLNFKGKTYQNPSYNSKKAKRKLRNSGHQLSRSFGVRAYPTFVFLDEKANLIAPIPGYKTPKQLEIYLKVFKGEDYKKIRSKEDFTKYANSIELEFEK